MGTTTIRSGDAAVLASPALIPMILGCGVGATTNAGYTFDAGAQVTDSFSGIGADFALGLLRQPGVARARFTACAPTWTPAPSVTHVGTGPAVTCALADGAPGCSDDHTILITCTTGGAGGAGAAMSVCYDGATVIETLPIPAEVPAVIRGKVDITYGGVLTGYVATVLTALHHDFTAPAVAVLTYGVGSLAASAAGLRAAFATSVAVQTWTTANLIDAGEAVILLNARKLIFTTAGVTPSDAPASVTITGTLRGAAQSEVLTLSQIAGAVSSAKLYDVITSLVFAAGDGNAATVALGYTSAFKDGQEIVDAFNALAIAAPLDVRARLAQTSTGQYLEQYSVSAGAAITVTQSAEGTSTAGTPLGFTTADGTLTATGAAAKFNPPWTGLSFTFPATSVYVKGDTYQVVAKGPRASLQAIIDAATAAKGRYKTAPFGFFVVAQPAADAASCAATEAALAALTAAWIADANAPVFVSAVTGAPFHVASATRATNDTAITTADAALLLAFAAASANLDNVALEDLYVPGSPSLRFGRYRRTATFAWAAKRAGAQKLAADVADGLIAEVSLLSPDGLTYARDDVHQATKLGGDQNAGFSALKSTSAGDGFVKFVPGATRMGAASRLRFCGVAGLALEVGRIVFPFVERWEGNTVQVNPAVGKITDKQMADKVKKKREGDLRALLAPTMQPGQDDEAWNCSAFTVQILDPAAGVFLDNGQVRIKVSFVPLGEITSTTIDIVATGEGTKIAA